MEYKGIQNLNELEFVMFCIENIAKQKGIDARRVYASFSKYNIIDGYIVPEYEMLHTQSKDYIIDDILDFIAEKGVVL